MHAEQYRCLVAGYGSIGKRHEMVLRQSGAKTAVVSKHAADIHVPCYSEIQNAINAWNPDYIVVANRTSEHMKTLDLINATGFRGNCLVEKPLAQCSLSIPHTYRFKIWVGYVMRFHPLVQRAAQILTGKNIFSINAYVGQYLPDWRPGTDYRNCYSARKSQGGGALRDLSHELDYIQLFSGEWKRVSALGGHVSNLEIETDDTFSLLIETQRGTAVLCQMNYFDRNRRRDCTINHDEGTLHLDFINNRLINNGDVQAVTYKQNEMFIAMHAAVRRSCVDQVCSFKKACETLELIDAAEKSAEERTWICNKNR